MDAPDSPKREAMSGVLPRGKKDLARQAALFGGAYLLYQLVRALVAHDAFDPGYTPFGDATKVITLERAMHVFVEPKVQEWTARTQWLMDLADWSYLHVQYVVSLAAAAFIYLRRNDSYYFVRNMVLVAMAIALLGYVVFPTAPPRLMPEWGFTDSIQQFTRVDVERGPSSQLLNLYAAVPSMHVCFAIMIGWPMAGLVRNRLAKALWLLYPPWIAFVVLATANHYLLDVVLGAATAIVAALVADRLARVRPHQWRFGAARARHV